MNGLRGAAESLACWMTATPQDVGGQVGKWGLILPIYVIHWNAPEWCAETVASLLASDRVEVDVTVIDNGSDVVPNLPHSVAIDFLPKNIGFTGGANRALALFRVRSEPYCCITSHDLRIERSALRRVAAVASENPMYGILGLNGEGLTGSKVIAREWISGTFLFLRRECIDTVGEFDPLFGSYVEDIDYSHRALAAGWKVGIVRDAIATSHGSIVPEQAVRMTNANLTLLAAKEGKYVVASLRLLGMLRRSLTRPRDHWLVSSAYTVRQLARWMMSRR
jgi:GT2 family glycosyltransferase